MRLSIIIPTWKRIDLLKKLVTSLLNQHVEFEYEIIVCDSHSPDGTAIEISKIQSSNDHLKIIQCDNSVSIKRNDGANFAQGDLLLFLDDDVQINDPIFLEKIIQCPFTNENVIYSGLVQYPENWVRSSNYYRYKNSRHFQKENNGHTAVEDWAFVSMCSLMKKSLFTKIGGYSEAFKTYGGEDHEFEFRTKDLGIKHIYMKNAFLFHHEGFTGINNFYLKIKKSASMYKYFSKNHPEKLNFKMKVVLMLTKYPKIFPLFLTKNICSLLIKFLDKTDNRQNYYIYPFFKILILCGLVEGLCEKQENNSFYH